MKITLDQRKLSIADHFDIVIDSRCKFTSRRGFFSSTIKLLNEKQELVAEIIRKSFSEFDGAYLIKIDQQKEYYFKTISWKHGIWEVLGTEKSYKIYEHEGFNYSIYKADEQVAKATKNDFVILGGDKFQLEANQDEDTLLLISIILCLDNAFFLDRGFRFGYSTKWHKDGKNRNWNWRPRKNHEAKKEEL